eukprot:2100434-Rhodomonas_salina.1
MPCFLLLLPPTATLLFSAEQVCVCVCVCVCARAGGAADGGRVGGDQGSLHRPPPPPRGVRHTASARARTGARARRGGG